MEFSTPCILIAVCSQLGHTDKREMIRQTWASEILAGITVRFFVGGEGQRPEPDTVMVDAPDTYSALPEKARGFLKAALVEDDLRDSFDWVFKCDDDTYVDLSRLPEFTRCGMEHVGEVCWIANRQAASGGSGYLLSRRLVELLAADDTLETTGAEDKIISGAAYRICGGRVHASNRLCHHHSTFPRIDNDLITAHWLNPDRMEAMHSILTMEPRNTLHVKHPEWEAELDFYSNGVCAKRPGYEFGWWDIIDGDLLVQWTTHNTDCLGRTGMTPPQREIIK